MNDSENDESCDSWNEAEARLGPDDHIVLHQVILSSVGEPLWKFKDAEHLLRGVLAIISGIEALEARGIVHRMISAGNVLLSTVESRPGYEAFLSDFEFAVVPKTELEVATPAEPAGEASSSFSSRLAPNTITRFTGTEVSAERRQGPPMTGTLQFMAIALIACIALQKPLPRHQTCHDLEALFWVILYALFRRVCFEEDREDDKRLKDVRELFDHLFGRLDPGVMKTNRVEMIVNVTQGSLRALNVMLHEDLRGFLYLIAPLVQAQNRPPAQFDSSEFLDPAEYELVTKVSADNLPPMPMTCASFRELVEMRLDILRRRKAQKQDTVL